VDSFVETTLPLRLEWSESLNIRPLKTPKTLKVFGMVVSVQEFATSLRAEYSESFVEGHGILPIGAAKGVLYLPSGHAVIVSPFLTFDQTTRSQTPLVKQLAFHWRQGLPPKPMNERN
jgi:hypothetical protein